MWSCGAVAPQSERHVGFSVYQRDASWLVPFHWRLSILQSEKLPTKAGSAELVADQQLVGASSPSP
jgi:hypothetical protein